MWPVFSLVQENELLHEGADRDGPVRGPRGPVPAEGKRAVDFADGASRLEAPLNDFFADDLPVNVQINVHEEPFCRFWVQRVDVRADNGNNRFSGQLL